MIYNEDCKEGLIKYVKNKSIDCCITSPPYWGQRLYGINPVTWNSTPKDKFCNHQWKDIIKIYKDNGKRVKHYTQICEKCNSWKGELGTEPVYEMYIEHLVSVFDIIYSKLKDDGTLFVNLSDTFSAGNSIEMCGCSDIKKKSLCQIPQRFVIRMIERGWILRNDIIWQKPNAMPNAVKDRFTIDYEHLFFFVKNQNYYFNQQFEPYTEPLNRRGGNLTTGNESKYDELIGQQRNRQRKIRPNEKGRNKRSVWQINTQSSQNKHCAVFPEKLVEIPILAGSRSNGLILDPFAGTGTTQKVAERLGRSFIGFEIDSSVID